MRPRGVADHIEIKLDVFAPLASMRDDTLDQVFGRPTHEKESQHSSPKCLFAPTGRVSRSGGSGLNARREILKCQRGRCQGSRRPHSSFNFFEHDG
jgi:hypothetical protein